VGTIRPVTESPRITPTHSANGPCQGGQEFESCLTSLGRVRLADPDYAGLNERVGLGSKKEAHGLARTKGGVRLQSQAISGKVNGSRTVFSLVTFYHYRDSHLHPLTLCPAFD